MVLLLLGSILIFTIPLSAQIDSRAAQIQAAREKKARELQPDVPSKVERALVSFKDKKILERLTAGIAGFRLKFGGLATGSGFALGPEYLRQELAEGNVVFRGSASASLKKYQLFDLQVTMPKLANDRLFVDLYAAHRNYPRMQYYGPGPDSAKTGRSNYRLEDTGYDATGGLKLLPPLTVGGTVGYLQMNIGPGTDPKFVSTEITFPPALTPGIDRQSDFLRGGVFAQFDYRDFPGGPRRGGNYVVQYTSYSDRKLDLHSFRKLDLEVQQYIPFFNDRRVIALRGKSVLSFRDTGQTVPFYLQPTLGGSDDLRGFRPFRFHDDNMLVMNAEYRWETFSGLDMALFADAGKVFRRRADWDLTDLEGAYGVGMRFNIRNSVFLRLDVGFSHEGFQMWVKFGNVF
jgi:outer membrane protein assembly factor BamA